MGALPEILVVDDEIRSQEALRRTLEEEFEVFTAGTAEQALEVMTREMVQVILCDQRMPGMSGVEFLKQVREQWPEVVRLIISGYTDSEDIISSINEAGIYQFVLKPWQPDLLVATLRNAAELYAMQMQEQRLHLELRTAQPVLRRRVAAQRAAVQCANHFDRITRAPESPLNRVIDMARKVAAYDIPMLITGESGSGKELVARAIHYGSSRGQGELRRRELRRGAGRAARKRALRAQTRRLHGRLRGAHRPLPAGRRRHDLSRRGRRNLARVPGEAAARPAGRRGAPGRQHAVAAGRRARSSPPPTAISRKTSSAAASARTCTIGSRR